MWLTLIVWVVAQVLYLKLAAAVGQWCALRLIGSPARVATACCCCHLARGQCTHDVNAIVIILVFPFYLVIDFSS